MPRHSACTSGNTADGCARVKECAVEPGAQGKGARAGGHSGANAHGTGPFRPLNRKLTCAINWYPPPLRQLDRSLLHMSFLLWDLPNWEEILFGNLAEAIATLSYINGSCALPKRVHSKLRSDRWSR